MYIASFTYATGSVFHQNEKNMTQKLTDHTALLFSGIVGDVLIGVSLTTIGLLAFSNLLPNLTQLPLTAKVVLVSSIFVVTIVNVTFSYYRFKKMDKELLKQKDQIEKETRKIQDQILTTSEENKEVLSLQIERRQQMVSEAERNLEKARSRNQMMQTQFKDTLEISDSQSMGILEEGLKLEKEIEVILQENSNLLQELQARVLEY